MSGMNAEQRTHYFRLAKVDKNAARDYRSKIIAAQTAAYYASAAYAKVQADAIKGCTRKESFYEEAQRTSRAQGSNVPDDHRLRTNRCWDALIVSSGWCLNSPDEKKIFFCFSYATKLLKKKFYPEFFDATFF